MTEKQTTPKRPSRGTSFVLVAISVVTGRIVQALLMPGGSALAQLALSTAIGLVVLMVLLRLYPHARRWRRSREGTHDEEVR